MQLREGRFFLKNDFLCTQSHIYTSIGGEEDTENTRNRLSTFFFKIKTELFFLVMELAEDRVPIFSRPI